MNDIKIFYNIVKKVVEDKSFLIEDDLPPIFSFEGLPGAGKTTQIIKSSHDLKDKYGKSYYIDLPTNSSVGLLLKALYSDKEIWNRIRVEAPWMNPLLLSIDLQLALQKAKEENAKYVLMSRGILSTYYYNYEAYMEIYKDFNVVWEKLTKVLQGFAYPKAIVFFELSAEEANKRVIKRNRGPLREMDKIENMTRDRELFDKYMERIKQEVPIYYIDASSEKDTVTSQIDDILSKYLEVQND